ncbi:gamma-glutamylcyclotransferase family protein [Actinomadura rugatobispora]|uniref:Putative gamma-glutamylcyclotransferase n=1 Tax=Actinomadura rugatobispora TaxID=1994 RepID=A0ABW1AJ59_9ACTN|nr:hypothetical protein GCM10010200_047090 [Actinomadura rugatobispora]
MTDKIGTNGLFVYGTLRFPEILEILLGRVPRLAPAAVAGWRVRALPGVTYPGLVADPDATAEGVLISGLTEAEQGLLDDFEDESYEPALLPLADGSGRARAYVWRGPTEPYDWDPGHFAEHALADFAKGCRSWLGGRL